MELSATVSTRLPGGVGAPRRARRWLLSHIDEQRLGLAASDAGLVVSELVTNSVLHAGVGTHELLSIDLLIFDDRLRITVSDPGSTLEPQLLTTDPRIPGGLGLRIVDHLSAAWGISHEPAGTTQVWCDLIVDRAPAA
jgi:anti-sigma regulatory factor (Ser/Thr protein kinase)